MPNLPLSKQDVIELGELLKSLAKFESNIRLQYLPDSKVPDRIYVQVRSHCTFGKYKVLRYAKYVGKKDDYTPEDLNKATEYIRQQHMDFVNNEAKKIKCRIEDFA